ncbi:hypothetical protein [Pelagibius sp. 7325]|uniref:hypothetical protein n=1 Tax=Pelagibius sp. 7325 TaxID=3131994 RepID=UPI0030EE3A7D
MKTEATSRRRVDRALRVTAWGLLVCLLPAAPLHAEDAVFPPGSSVGLVPPAGMTLSGDFTGFMNPENGASIMMVAMPPVAYDEVSTGMTEQALAKQGMTLTGTCEAARPAFESVCFRATQQAMGQQYQKWLLVVRLPKETGMVVVTVPEAALHAGAYSNTDLDEALATLAYSNTATADPLAILPFTIEEGELLPFQQTLGGSAALYAAAPSAATPQPLWVVAGSLGAEPLAKTIDYSRAAFYDIASVEEPEIVEEGTFEANQLAGYILEGQAKDKETAATLYVFQAILVDAEGKYYRMVGLTPAATRDTYRPEFLRLARTLQPR